MNECAKIYVLSTIIFYNYRRILDLKFHITWLRIMGISPRELLIIISLRTRCLIQDLKTMLK